MLRTHLADLSTEFLMQTLEEVLEPQLAENDDVKRVRKHVEVKQSNLGRRSAKPRFLLSHKNK